MKYYHSLALSLFPLNCVLLACISVHAGASPLTPQEIQMRNFIIERKEEQISLLKKLVVVNSGSENTEGVRQVGEILRPQLEALGFKTRWVQNEIKPTQSGQAVTKRAPALVAEREGKKGKRLLLLGHLDTVFPKDSPFQTFERKATTATGPGVTDMKGGDVVILYALKALADAKVLEDTTLRVVFTGDEESSAKPTSISRKFLVELAEKSDIALDFEPTQRGYVSIARRGIVHWSIEAKGIEGHSSLIFSENLGYGAIFELSRVLNEMRVTLSSEKHLTFNPGVLLGGTQLNYDKGTWKGSLFGKDNIISQTAMARGDLRFLTEEQKLQVERKIEAILSTPLPGTRAQIIFEESSMPPLPPTDASLKLFEQYNQISQNLDSGELKLLPPDQRGGGDISYIGSVVSACLIGIGANGTHEHSHQETLDVDSLAIQSQRAALFIYALTH